MLVLVVAYMMFGPGGSYCTLRARKLPVLVDGDCDVAEAEGAEAQEHCHDANA